VLEALLTLNALPKLGPLSVRRLIERFGTAEAVLAAPSDKLRGVNRVGPELARIIRDADSYFDPATELRELRERGLSLLTPEDPAFPPALREAPDCPLLLYVWGRLEERDRHALGVVGTRRISHYGREATKKLSFQLAHAGFTILSGLARGVDTTAHEAAIAAGGRTVAVIGSGLAEVYPAENLPLAERIADGHGAVVSEFPLHTPPDKQTFPQRNRIVAAWSAGLLVTESPARSGSLITANLAGDYGRPVFAVPGPITQPGSAGCHQLIRDGATLVSDAGEVLDELGQLPLPAARPDTAPDTAPAAGPAPAAAPPLPEEEQRLLAALEVGESGVDQLVDRSGLPAPTVTATLLKLEMKRLVRALPGFRYARR